MTNYDRIRNMSVEEMAEFLKPLTDIEDGCYNCPANDFCNKNLSKWGCSVMMFKQWLESEVWGE